MKNGMNSGYGLVIGLCIGTAIGAATGSIGLWLPVGLCIGLILLSCLLLITNTNVRRKYYVGNYAAVGLNVAANICTAVWAHGQLTAFKAQFLKLDFDALQFHAELWETPYIDSTFWFDAHYAVFAITLAVAALLILNTIWKMKLMKEEKQLLKAGKAVSA